MNKLFLKNALVVIYLLSTVDSINIGKSQCITYIYFLILSCIEYCSARELTVYYLIIISVYE